MLVMMTTYNRPKLLAQSLPQVERETNSIGAQLVIHDDQSDDLDTLALLEEVKQRGAYVFSRDYNRTYTDLNSHNLTGMANVALWKKCLSDYDFDIAIKIDDDAYILPGTLKKLVETWSVIREKHEKALWLSAISTIYEDEVEDYGEYARTDGACNACVVFTRDRMKEFLDNNHPAKIMLNGYDTMFLQYYVRKGINESYSLKPSMVYHCGHSGVHLQGVNINRNFAGETYGIYTE